MIDWQLLVVTVAGRSAIYDENIPAALERAIAVVPDAEAANVEVDQRFLSDVPATFAGAWGSLGRTGELGRVQYVGLSPAGCSSSLGSSSDGGRGTRSLSTSN